MAVVRIKAILTVDEDTLAEAFDTDEDFNFNDAFSGEMGWVEASGIQVESYEIEKE